MAHRQPRVEAFSSKDLQRMYRVSKDKIEKDRRRGLLRGIKVGAGSVRFLRADVDKWLGLPR
jgi:predicted DNA-binding transcriptional regulator AlpA